jgi:predicted Zn finger-like uncharacterized protein
MKIECSECNAVYNIPDHKVAGQAMKAVCKKCGANMVIDGTSGTVQVHQQEPDSESTRTPAREARASEPKLPETTKKVAEDSSVYSMSPPYPRYRNPLIIGTVILAFVGLLAVVYFAVRGTQRSLDELIQNPMQYIAGLIMGSEKYGLCESFLRHNEKQLALVLGRDLRFFPVKEEVRVISGREMAIVVMRVQGSKATKDVVFRLQQHNDKWRILDVVLDLGTGKQKRLYP